MAKKWPHQESPSQIDLFFSQRCNVQTSANVFHPPPQLSSKFRRNDILENCRDRRNRASLVNACSVTARRRPFPCSVLCGSLLSLCLSLPLPLPSRIWSRGLSPAILVSSVPFRFVPGWLASPTCVNIWLKHVKTIPRPRSRESFQRASQNFISRQKTPNDFPPRRISGSWREFANTLPPPYDRKVFSYSYPFLFLLLLLLFFLFSRSSLFSLPSAVFPFNFIFIRPFYCPRRPTGTREPRSDLSVGRFY